MLWNAKRQDVIELFRFIDWVMELTADLEKSFQQSIADFEKEESMPYLSNFERAALKRGLEQGLEQGLEKGREEGFRQGLLDGLAWGLEVKFGARGKRWMSRVRRVKDTATLQRLGEQLKTAANLDELRKTLE